ncbi:MAG TPA: energy transducer TonB [Rhizomicrobium sp.]|nr:energy transducer TonB [Rhizomicrobium sp.]
MTRARLAGFALCLASAAASAQEESGLPLDRALACLEACAKFVPAKTADNAKPPFPQNVDRTATEAFVQISYTIGTDGVVKTVTLLHLIGAKEFADTAIAYQKARKYTPASLNGKPVEETRLLEIVFGSQASPGGKPVTATAYNSALDQIKAKKFDDASATLAKAVAEPNLNLYERAMLDNLSALIAIEKKDFHAARAAVELPTEYYPDKVSSDVLRNMVRYRIIADLGLNDIDDAVRTVNIYRRSGAYNPTDPLLATVDSAQAQADSLPVLSTTKRIGGDPQMFVLSRRTFGFTTVSGSLQAFKLNCRQGSMESQIAAKSEWHVPKDWDRCYLLVQGAPGTVYRIDQTKD